MANHTTILLFFLVPILGYSSISKVNGLHERCYELFSTNYDSVIIIADEALALAEKNDYAWGIANSYYIKAYAYDEKGDLSKALLMYLNASNTLDDQPDERAIKTNLDIALNVGSILRKYYKYDESISFYDNALEKVQEKKFLDRKLKLLYNKASALQDGGRLEEAIEVLDEAVLISEKTGNHRMLMKCWNLLGIINKDDGNFKQAKHFYQKIISFQNDDKRVLALAYHNMGIVAHHEKNYDSAIISFNTAERLGREVENNEFLFRTLYETAKTYLKTGSAEKALYYSNESEKLYQYVNGHPETFSIFHLLDSLSHLDGNYEKSRYYADLYRKESIAFFENQKEMIKLKDQFQVDLLLVGFYKELEAKRRNMVFQKIIISLLLLGFVSSLYFYIRHWAWRNNLKKAVEPYIAK